jgi:hypothetical protein
MEAWKAKARVNARKLGVSYAEALTPIHREAYLAIDDLTIDAVQDEALAPA